MHYWCCLVRGRLAVDFPNQVHDNRFWLVGLFKRQERPRARIFSWKLSKVALRSLCGTRSQTKRIIWPICCRRFPNRQYAPRCISGAWWSTPKGEFDTTSQNAMGSIPGLHELLQHMTDDHPEQRISMATALARLREIHCKVANNNKVLTTPILWWRMPLIPF